MTTTIKRAPEQLNGQGNYPNISDDAFTSMDSADTDDYYGRSANNHKNVDMATGK